MDYHAIHGHDVANFSTPLTREFLCSSSPSSARGPWGLTVSPLRNVGLTSDGFPDRVLTVSAAEADAALLSQSSASSTTSETAPSASRFLIPTGIETLDCILAGVEPPVHAGGDGPTADEPAKTAETEGDAAQRGGSPAEAAASKAAAAHPTGGIRRGQLAEIWGPPGVGKTAFGYVDLSLIAVHFHADHERANASCAGYNSQQMHYGKAATLCGLVCFLADGGAGLHGSSWGQTMDDRG